VIGMECDLHQKRVKGRRCQMVCDKSQVWINRMVDSTLVTDVRF